MVLEVPEGKYQEEVIAASFQKPVLVDLWAKWCGPCRLMVPLMDRIETEIGAENLKVVKVNTEVHTFTVADYKVEGLPRMLIIKDGTPIASFEGAMPYPQLLSFVQDNVPKPEEVVKVQN